MFLFFIYKYTISVGDFSKNMQNSDEKLEAPLSSEEKEEEDLLQWFI